MTQFSQTRWSYDKLIIIVYLDTGLALYKTNKYYKVKF